MNEAAQINATENTMKNLVSAAAESLGLFQCIDAVVQGSSSAVIIDLTLGDFSDTVDQSLCSKVQSIQGDNRHLSTFDEMLDYAIEIQGEIMNHVHDKFGEGSVLAPIANEVAAEIKQEAKRIIKAIQADFEQDKA